MLYILTFLSQSYLTLTLPLLLKKKKYIEYKYIYLQSYPGSKLHGTYFWVDLQMIGVINAYIGT